MVAWQNYSRPSFFKVMTGDFDRKLKIPMNFTENFNGMTPNDSVLRSQLGCWNVKVREDEDGGLSFRKGWPDFVQAHSLVHDDFITMKYIGNSQFSVKLYGKNGCEKVLPDTGSNGVKSTPSRKRKEHGETSRGKFTNNGSNVGQRKSRGGDIRRDLFCSDKRNCGSVKRDALKRKATVTKGRTKVDQAECSRKRKPCFLAIWTENKKLQMEIPEKVIRKIGRTLSDIVALKSPNDRLWNVELKRAEGKVWFYKGWKEFAEHHCLRDGHVLGISYNGNSQFRVRITSNVMGLLDDSRNQGDSNPKKRCRLNKKEEREEDHNVILLDAPPSGTPVESKTNEELAEFSVPPGLGIPMELNKNEGTKSLISDETGSPYYLGNERTPSGERLPIVRLQESEDMFDSPESPKPSHKSSLRIEGSERVAEVTKLFNSQTQYPFFAVCMQNTYLAYGYLHIPNWFAKKHLPKNTKNVIVRSSSDNKVWTLGYFIRGCATKLSSGWSSLRRDLGVREGDVCVFELLKEKDTEMRVSVFREIDNVLTKI